jgi:hypothetical protein
MGPSERTFNQVKGILTKLDRSIDQLRAQRTQPATSPSSAVIAADPPQSGVAAAVVHAVVQAASPVTPTPPRSPFGRATPLPPK